MQGKYIYGIIDSSNDTALGITGLDGVNPVYTVTYRGVGFVVSDCRGTEFNSMSKEEVVRCLLRHQVVVEHVMRQHTVLPAKFGTILATAGEVHGLLAQGHSQFVDALARMGDKVEIEVAATWDTEPVLQEISKEEGIARAREAIARGPGPPTLEQRIHLGKMVRAALERRRDIYRERMIDCLKPLAADVQANVLVSDQMVMNVAFLVDRAKQPEFDSGVRRLNDLFHEQLDFRMLGPLPPYSFATVEVTRLSPERLAEARHLLGLKETPTETEVRRAYRRLAAAAHPDSRPGDEPAKAHFVKLRQASDVLIAYCRSQAQPGGLSISISRRTVEDQQHLRLAETPVLTGAAHG